MKLSKSDKDTIKKLVDNHRLVIRQLESIADRNRKPAVVDIVSGRTTRQEEIVCTIIPYEPLKNLLKLLQSYIDDSEALAELDI